MNERTKIAVAGATGRLGRHIVEVVEERGYKAMPMSRTNGVDVVTGDGLAEALAGVETVIDAASHPTPEEGPATEFFVASSRNLQQLGAEAGVKRLVVVSIIGIDDFTAGFLAAKKVHEREVLAGPLPVRILRAAQFHEFVEPLLQWMRQENGVRYVPNMQTQLVAARTVAEALVDMAADAESSGPSTPPFPEARRPPGRDARRRRRSARGASRRVGADPGVHRPLRSGRRGLRERRAAPRPRCDARRPDLRGMARRRGTDVTTPPQLTRSVRAPPAEGDARVVRRRVPSPRVRSSYRRNPVPEEDAMKYLLQIYPDMGLEEFARLPADEQEAIVDEYLAVHASPGVVGGAQLQPVDTATTVRVQSGEMLLTDGPFMDAKEHVGGFLLVEAEDLDGALDIAARIPAARMGGAVEVRPLVER